MSEPESVGQVLAKIKPTNDGTCFWEDCASRAESDGMIHTLTRNIPYRLCIPHYLSVFNYVMRMLHGETRE